MEGIITVDLHGKNQYQARIAIDSTLRRCDRSVYRLRLVHGHHGGTVLRDMVRTEYASHPKVKRLLLSPDGGTTVLVLREF